MTRIHFANGRLSLEGMLQGKEIFFFSQSLYILAEKQRHQQITLDFSKAYPIKETFMVPALALIRKYRHEGVTFFLTLPDNLQAKNIFHNANWSYLINDQHFEKTTFDGSHHLPASVFKVADEQSEVVDSIMSLIIKAISLERKQLKALEWAVNEISDNVLNHANSPTGGVIQASTILQNDRKFVEFVVADAGESIPLTLGFTDHVYALEKAIQEGVTRNSQTNQGNGLFGSFKVSTLSKGRFEIHSGKASLWADEDDAVNTRPHQNRLYKGTCVICRIGCDDEKLIENALVFNGKKHDPGYDYIEKKYEDAVQNRFYFRMSGECASFGSREAGVAARHCLENLLKAEKDYPIWIDFEGVNIISSSFADEVFGRLFLDFGPMAFLSRFNFMNIDSSVRAVIDRAILQRSSASPQR